MVEREADLRAAERRVWFLSSPMAPYQVSWWFTNKGPPGGAGGAGGIRPSTGSPSGWEGGRWGRCCSGAVAGDAPEREGRAETLRRVFDSTASVVIVVLGILTALNQAGVNVTVLLGGGRGDRRQRWRSGSQNLIKDYFSGFMILMENQYSVGNVVRVGAGDGDGGEHHAADDVAAGP